MSEFEIKNAVIEKAILTTESRGCLESWVYVKYQGGGQGFGGYALHLPKDWTHADPASQFAGHWIMRVMEVAGVTSWDQLPGKCIQVDASWNKIRRIGHIIEPIWFDPEAEFKALKVLEGKE